MNQDTSVYQAEPIDIQLTNAGLECPCCYYNQTFYSGRYHKWRCTKCGLLFELEDTYRYEPTPKGLEVTNESV